MYIQNGTRNGTSSKQHSQKPAQGTKRPKLKMTQAENGTRHKAAHGTKRRTVLKSFFL
jgi:hypothetical protein